MTVDEALKKIKAEIRMYDEDSPESVDWEECYEALKQEKQELKQESILDNLKAELHSTAEMHEDGDYYLRDEWIDEYFDKYKAESENNK